MEHYSAVRKDFKKTIKEMQKKKDRGVWIKMKYTKFLQVCDQHIRLMQEILRCRY
jgi:hypothetical protein